MDDVKPLYATKTFWAGAAAILAAAAGYFQGEMVLANALTMGFTGLIGMLLRHNLPKA